MALRQLGDTRMVRHDTETGELTASDLGRTCSYYYINLRSVEVFKEKISSYMTEADILHMMCLASEFANVKVSLLENK